MLVAQNSLGPVCPVPLTVRGISERVKVFFTIVSSAHASTATATASVYFLSAWYCSAPPARLIRRQSASCPPLSQCWRWQASLQYLVLHLLHRFLWSWASGAAQAAQFVRIIWRWRGVCRAFASRDVFFFGDEKIGFDLAHRVDGVPVG